MSQPLDNEDKEHRVADLPPDSDVSLNADESSEGEEIDALPDDGPEEERGLADLPPDESSEGEEIDALPDDGPEEERGIADLPPDSDVSLNAEESSEGEEIDALPDDGPESSSDHSNDDRMPPENEIVEEFAVGEEIPPTDKLEDKVIEEKEKVELLKEITRINNWVNAGADNGLFVIQQNESKYTKILDFLKEAKKSLQSNDLPDAGSQVSNAIQSYSEAVHSTSKRWRFSNYHGGYIWIYLIVFLSLILFFYIGFIFGDDGGTRSVGSMDVNTTQSPDNSSETDLPPGEALPPEEVANETPASPYDILKSGPLSGVEDAAIHAVTWGAIGGILRGLWFLKDKVGDHRYRKAWRIYFLSVPFLGAIFGAIVYFIVVVGLLALGGTDVDTIQITDTAPGADSSGEMDFPPDSDSNETPTGENSNETPTGENSNEEELMTIDDSNKGIVENPIAIIPLAALAGFNWEWIVMVFKSLGERFSPGSTKQSFEEMLEGELTKIDK